MFLGFCWVLLSLIECLGCLFDLVLFSLFALGMVYLRASGLIGRVLVFGVLVWVILYGSLFMFVALGCFVFACVWVWFMCLGFRLLDWSVLRCIPDLGYVGLGMLV